MSGSIGVNIFIFNVRAPTAHFAPVFHIFQREGESKGEEEIAFNGRHARVNGHVEKVAVSHDREKNQETDDKTQRTFEIC